jgi:hypothetical protein
MLLALATLSRTSGVGRPATVGRRCRVGAVTARADNVAYTVREVAEPDGFPVDRPCATSAGSRTGSDVPDDAAWPRLMSPPSPRAVGSYGEEFVAFADAACVIAASRRVIDAAGTSDAQRV